MKKKTLSKTEIRNMAANYIIGIFQNLEVIQSFDDIDDEEVLVEIDKEVRRYSIRLINYFKRIRDKELEKEK